MLWVTHLVNGTAIKGPICILVEGKRGLEGERATLQRPNVLIPLMLQEAVQLKPKPRNMSDFVNYSKQQLLTPR